MQQAQTLGLVAVIVGAACVIAVLYQAVAALRYGTFAPRDGIDYFNARRGDPVTFWVSFVLRLVVLLPAGAAFIVFGLHRL